VPGGFGLDLGSETLRVFVGPIIRRGDGSPCLDIVPHCVLVPVSWWHGRGKHHVDPDLQRGDDREPLQQRRHVLPPRRDHPLGLPVEHALFEEGDRIAGIDEIDDPHPSPIGRSLGGAVAVADHTEIRAALEDRPPRGRAFVAVALDRAPDTITKGRARPDGAIERSPRATRALAARIPILANRG